MMPQKRGKNVGVVSLVNKQDLRSVSFSKGIPKKSLTFAVQFAYIAIRTKLNRMQ